jgi:glutamate synthase (NADPH/NADH) small chain
LIRWPQWPRVYGLDYGHSEVMAVYGNDPRQYNIVTTEFKGDPSTNTLTSVVTQQVEVDRATGKVTKLPGTEKEWPADLVILSMGFIHPEKTIISQLGLEIDSRNNIHASASEFQTNIEGIFAAGDCRRGQSLVVWAIDEGRKAAKKCHDYLEHYVMKGETDSSTLDHFGNNDELSRFN